MERRRESRKFQELHTILYIWGRCDVYESEYNDTLLVQKRQDLMIIWNGRLKLEETIWWGNVIRV